VKRDFLKLADLSQQEHEALFARALELKQRRREHLVDTTLQGRTLALVFEKHSTRTRLSFEAAMFQLGGNVISLNPNDSQLARGESLADTARVTSRYADCIMLRTYGEERLLEVAKHSTVPVINGLTDASHPVQLLADLLTVRERLGSITGKVVALIGDGSNNMTRSWMEAARLFGFTLRIAAPKDYRPPAEELATVRDRVILTADPAEAARGADVVTTDVWTSMGQEAESARRLAAFRGYCVDEQLMSHAKKTAIVLHCLPAHRGEEISASVLEGPASAVWDEAENRMHAQKALLEKLILAR
jgi:ornithine carbamoyltransferase